MQAQSRKFAKRALIVVLLVILTEVLCENFIVEIYNKQSHTQAFYLLLGYMFSQILFAPIQSGLSDFIGRKKSLFISLLASFLSLAVILVYIKKVFFWFPLLIFATLIKGIAGNNLPLALSVIADTQGKNYRFSFALSSGTYAIAYLLFSSRTSDEVYVNYILSFTTVFLSIVCISSFFKDFKDEDNYKTEEKNKEKGVVLSTGEGKRVADQAVPSLLHIIEHEPALILDDLKQKPTQEALAAFLLWEISMYSIVVSQVDFQLYTVPRLAATMMLGYLTGVVILKFCFKIRDSQMIKIGYYVSSLSLIPYFLFRLFFQESSIILQACFFFHAMGNAFLSPTFMAILAKEKAAHEQGKRYGLVDSVDTLGFLIATVVIMLFRYLEVPLFGLVGFSFLCFMFSWRFYGRFKNLRQE